MIFSQSGIQKVGLVFKKKDCQKLIKGVYKTRNINNLFLSKKDWLSKKWELFKQNPSPGRNLLDKLETKFIFENSKLSSHMSKVLGNRYRILDAKFVMSIPEKFIPNWVLELKKDHHAVNLGEFIKPKYRDITYFNGIDFHQDIIDWPTRGPDFVTAYIYLNDVNIESTPLFVIPKSHLLGASSYPHKLTKLKKNTINYIANKKSLISKYKVLNGKSGSLFYWHPFILHGTQPSVSKIARVSVRILIEKKERIFTNCLLDKINKKIIGKNKKLKIYNKSEDKRGNVINTVR